LKHFYYPKIALGLSYVNLIEQGTFRETQRVHVFNVGIHVCADEVCPVILDAKRPMFFRTLGSVNEGGHPHHAHLPPVESVDTVREFSFLTPDRMIVDQEFSSDPVSYGFVSLNAGEIHATVRSMRAPPRTQPK
jgi:hypothetical protein